MGEAENLAVGLGPERSGREGDQPLPLDGMPQYARIILSCERDLIAELIERLRERAAVGLRRYGKPLRAFNGRDAARDLEDELLDGAAYARQMAVELAALELAVLALGRRVRGEDAEFGSVEAALEVAGAVEAKLARRRGGG